MPPPRTSTPTGASAAAPGSAVMRPASAGPWVTRTCIREPQGRRPCAITGRHRAMPRRVHLASPAICPQRRATRPRAALRWNIIPRPAAARTAAVPASAAADLRDQHDLAVGVELGLVGVLEDLAVDRHRHALVDLMAEAGKATLQLGDQPAHRVRLDVELGLPAGEAAGSRAGDDDVRHQHLTLSLSP